jgi:hypothetical protein
MANPKGFRVASGQTYKVNRYAVTADVATAMYKGDQVMQYTDGSVRVMTAASDDYLGIVMKLEDTNHVELTYLPASTAGYAVVMDDPLTELVVRTSADATALTAAAIGDCADGTYGAGDTGTGESGHLLSETLVGDGNSAQFRIIGLDERCDNAWGSHGIDVRVLAKEHCRLSTPVAI